VALLRRTLLRLADRPVAAAVAALRPAMVVSFHALATGAAVGAAGRPPGRLPVVTVVTDVGTAHASWCHDGADLTVVPSAAAGRCCRSPRGGPDCLDLGLPVAAGFSGGPLPAAGRQALRRSLGLPGRGFLAVVTGGGEGAGELARSARLLLDGFGDVHVAAICGRNERARRRLARLADRASGRLTVRGFVGNMADWLRCADVVVTKAGPGTIAEAACCGAPLILTSHLPGQEASNARLVVAAGAGRYAARPADLTREIARLRADPAAVAAMRAASARLGRPGAAAAVAALIAGLADAAVTPRPALPSSPRPLVTAAAGQTARAAGPLPAGKGE
jgi:1,2-diacylglycerol 3-beta-galactosyltransferase